MVRVRKQLYRIICLSIAFLSAIVMFAPSLEAAEFSDILDERSPEEGYYSMRDQETEEIIMKTARLVHVGDEYINHDKFCTVLNYRRRYCWARNLKSHC